MASGNTVKAGAAYEAVLVDKVTARVDAIVASLGKLQTRFDQMRPGADTVNQAMQGISGAMREVTKTVKAQNPMEGLAKSARHAAQTLGNAGQSIGQTFIHIGTQMRAVGLIATGLAASIGYGIFDAVKVFGESEETLSAFNQTFKESAVSMNRWVANFVAGVGRTETSAREALLGFQGMFSQLDVGEGVADNLSKAMYQLSLDFAAFRNLGDDEAIAKMMSGLSGEMEVLRRYGILVDDASVRQHLLSKGVEVTSGAIDQQTKLLARYEIIVKRTRELGIVGQLARESGSFANQMKRLSAAFNNLRKEVGSRLIKDVTNVVNTLRSLIETATSSTNIGAFTNALRGLMVMLATGGAAVAFFGSALIALGPIIIGVTTTLAALGATVAGAVASPIYAVGVAVVALGAILTSFFTYLTIKNFPITQALGDLRVALSNLGQQLSGTMLIIRNAVANQDWSTAFDAMIKQGELAAIEIGLVLFANIGEAVFEGFRDGLKRAMKWAAGSQFPVLKGLADFASDVTDGSRDSQTFMERLSSRAEELRNELSAMQIAAQEASNRSATMQGIIQQAALNNLLDGIEKSLEKARSEGGSGGGLGSITSVGSLASAFAQNAGLFAPSMSPLESNQKEQISLQQQQLDEAKSTNESLNEIKNSELTFQ